MHPSSAPPPLGRTTGSCDEPPPWDVSLRYVRVRHQRACGLVEFDFAVGEPEVFVEMVLPAQAFDDFCRTQMACILPETLVSEQSTKDDWDWRLSDAANTRFK